MMKKAVGVPRMTEMQIAYKILVGNRELTRSVGRPGSTWEDNIKILFK
jgi:hypothetical protein